MGIWLVRDAPVWLVGGLLIGGLPAAMLGLDALIHRTMPHRRLGRHNAVTGVIVSVVGVAYAVIIGLCVVSLWDGFNDAEHTIRAEAANLTALVPSSAVFGPDAQRRITAEIISYEQDLVNEWSGSERGLPGRRSAADLGRLAELVNTLQPATVAQQSFVDDAIKRIGLGQQLRQQALSEAEHQQMSGVMWLGVLSSTLAILCLCVFFGLDDAALRRVLLILCSAVIATNLFLIVQMNYPYYGTFSVTPASYRQVVKDLRQLSQ
jgi:hypothetical protein